MSDTRPRLDLQPASNRQPPSSRVRFRPARGESADAEGVAWLEPCIDEDRRTPVPDPVPYLTQLSWLLLDDGNSEALVVTETGEVLMANSRGWAFANGCSRGELVAVLAGLGPGPHSGFEGTQLAPTPSSPSTYLLVRKPR